VQEVLATLIRGNESVPYFLSLSSISIADRFELLEQVLSYLTVEEIDLATQKALAIVRSIEPKPKTEYMAVFLPYLSEAMKETMGRELLAAAWTMEGNNVREMVMHKVISSLPESLIEEALATEKGVEKKRRAEILSAVALSLSEPLLREVLAALRAIEDEQEQAIALAALLPHQPQLTWQTIMERVQFVKSDSQIVQALLDLAAQLPEPLRLHVVQEVLDRIPALAEDQQVEFLKILVSFLPETLFQDALEIIQQIKDLSKRVDVLLALASHIPESSLAKSLEVVWTVGDETEEARLLTALAPRLPDALLKEAFEQARQMNDHPSQSRVLRALAPHLSENLRREALNIVGAMQDSEELLRMQIALASFEGEAQVSTVLNAVLISTSFYKFSMLSELAPSLSENLLGEALELVKVLEKDSSKMDILKILRDARIITYSG
jgi:hypothetical protein